MEKELNVAKIEQQIFETYSETARIVRVLTEANATSAAEKELLKKLSDSIEKCEALYSRVEEVLEDAPVDTARELTLKVDEYRKKIQEIKNVYLHSAEPNA